MARQLLLVGLALVAGGCGSVEGSALYDDVGEAAPPEPGQDLLDAPATPGPHVTPPGAAEADAEGDATLSPEDDAADAATEDTAPVDGQAPSIVWSSPADGAVAVAADAEIMIQFSEVMDRAATEAAYQGTLGDGVRFSWSHDDRRLTVKPAVELAYATGPEPLQALGYDVSFSGARDLAGNVLVAAPFVFYTRRRVELTLSPVRDPRLTGSVRGDGRPPSGECVTALCAGDASAEDGGAPETQHKAFLSFDLSALPVRLLALEGAHIELTTADTEGDPFGGLGELHVERSDFARIGSAPFFADPDATLGVLEDGAEHVLSGDIRWVVQEDLAAGRYSQFRLCFPQIDDNDGATDLVRFAPAEQRLSITVLAP
jgi:hypothetical protein